MAVNLQKGQNVSLEKLADNLTQVLIGLGWNVRSTDGAPFDLDASVFLLGADGRVRNDEDFIFFNNLKASDGSVEHLGDNRVGDTAGDDEAIKINLSKVSPNVQKIVMVVTIHEAEARRQNFGQVNGAYVRLMNETDGKELARYDLTEDASIETSMVFAEVYRSGSGWKFKAVGQGKEGGLRPLALQYGVNV